MAEKVIKRCQNCGAEYETYDYYDAVEECSECISDDRCVDSMAGAM